MTASLRHGPLGPRTAHLCIDMQNMFAKETPWHTPWMERVLPVVATLAEAHAAQTVFTRFIPPERPEARPGRWRAYFERWRSMTRERLHPELLDLVAPLPRLVPPATVVDKPVYSAFAAPELRSLLVERHIDSLVITGAETDMCVLATVMSAVDRGYRVVLAVDGVCSSSDRTHDALMTLYNERFSEQIETCTAAAILANWA
ncbi:MAG: cysteine hydrolase family protein [Gemmatimonas sp.]